MTAHGAYSTYTNHGCRCAACRAALASYTRAYRAGIRARGQCLECRRPSVFGRARCERHLIENAARVRAYRAKAV